MSYTRILEDGCYIYPKSDKAGIQIEVFPEEELDFIPDVILDVILYKMSDKEIQERKIHGSIIRDLMRDNNFEEISKQKDFFEWRKKNV